MDILGGLKKLLGITGGVHSQDGVTSVGGSNGTVGSTIGIDHGKPFIGGNIRGNGALVGPQGVQLQQTMQSRQPRAVPQQIVAPQSNPGSYPLQRRNQVNFIPNLDMQAQAYNKNFMDPRVTHTDPRFFGYPEDNVRF